MSMLDAYLKRHKLTQVEFARQAGLSQGAVSKLCAGTRGISLQTAAIIERVTNGEVPLSAWVPEPPASEARIA